MNFGQICCLLFLLETVTLTESFLCTQSCAFIGIPMNQSRSWNGCPKINTTSSQCSVFMRIDQNENIATGRLGIEKCTDSDFLRTETVLTINATVSSILRYSCAKNGCDTNFLNRLFPNKLFILDESTANYTIDSIFNNAVNSTFNCAPNLTCASNQFCEKFFIEDNSTRLLIDNSTKPSCINETKFDYLLNIQEFYSSNKNGTTRKLTFRCNTEHCDNDSFTETVYNKMQNSSMISSFNISGLDTNKTCSSSTPSASSIAVLSYRLLIFIPFHLLCMKF
ncbi:hypothetical protein I4U23_030513 [Adineta vaga]|nr:hypothetical protein I4U23_030513 [Adineta vaga]